MTHAGVLAAVAGAIFVLSANQWGGLSAARSLMAPDALLETQWNLKARSSEPGGANVRAAWPSTTGTGIVIGIVDDGVQYAHPDLSPNYLAAASYDFNFNDADPQPFSTSAHGTAVAGVAVARGDNSIGVAGVAPTASLAALRLTAVTPTDAQEAAAFGYQPNVIHILNNSWSPSDNGTTLKGPLSQAVAARQSAALTGRSGKGRIFVQQSGNGRLAGDDCNYDGYANSRFVIAVGAANDLGNQASYSEGCSALMLLAPSGGGQRSITTTDLLSTPGYDQGDYTSTLSTTSAAAPAVSGAVALMLARNPNLTWRDVQHILRRSSVRILPTDAGWTNQTFRHNERLGFGLLDATAAADMAAGWVNVPAEEMLSASRNLNVAIPDINNNGVNDTITISSAESNFVIEHVEVEFDATHTWRGDLQVKLTAPNGIVSMLAPIRPTDAGDNYPAWKFGSVRHWGDSPAGSWTLNVSDRRFQDTGTWRSWSLRIYGHRTTMTAPGAFNKSAPSNGATGQSTSPTLSWGSSSSASSYEYCIDTTNDNACNGWTGAGAGTSVALSGLSAGTTYYWQARAGNAAGTTYANGSASAFWSFTTASAPTPPGAFAKSSPASGSTGQSLTPTISWGASSGASSYEYCYDTTNDNACSAWSGTGANTSANLSGLAPGVTYFWQVRAIGSGGTTYANGATTAYWSFTTVAAPGTFGKSAPSNGAGSQPLTPTLSWSASSGAANYDYCYDTTNDNACSNWIGAGASTSVGLSGLTSGLTYYWQVRAVSGGGITYANGAATSFWSFTTVAAPGTFGKSTPSNGASSQSLNPTLSWAASSGAANYDYCIDTTNNNSCNSWIGTGASTSVALSGLSPNTTYYWHVRAVNGGGTTYANGSSTAFWSFTTGTLPGAFGKTSPTSGATGQSLTPTVSWAASAGATSYEYCYDSSDDDACANWVNAGANTSAMLSGLSPGVAYYWQVRANSVAGATYANGGPTAFWGFITIALPGAFSHSSPVNGAQVQSITRILSWTASSGVANYDYCYDTTNDNACSNWIGAGASTSVGLSGLSAGITYYWQVRATNGGGTTYADGSASAFWSFTTRLRDKSMVDLNGDGKGDAFTYNDLTGDWARQVSNGTGGFNTTNGSWNPGWNVVPASFNDDALTDFFLFNPVSGQWFKMLNTGTSFSAQSTGNWWQGWERYVMDLNGDEITDLFLYDPSTGQWFKAIATENGFHYIQGGWGPGWEVYPMTLNSDAMADMFLINRSSGRWFWVLGAAGNEFTYPLTETWYPQWMFYPGDFNGDGLTDVLLHDPPTGALFVATNTVSGFTYTQGGWSLGWTPGVADLNADGKDDLFLHDYSTGVWFQLISNGAGGFANAGGQVWSLGWKLNFTDLNGDGRSDMILYDAATGAWYQARNFTLGSFSYNNGNWAPGLKVIVARPIR
jgi:subtilisin-like proprotein convertase family protein